MMEYFKTDVISITKNQSTTFHSHSTLSLTINFSREDIAIGKLIYFKIFIPDYSSNGGVVSSFTNGTIVLMFV